ncbi:MAG: hypothetical protein JWQ98_654 [Chlorobi bacterium]|nr:hypothetical protein [Chlorobiota bacterium]
MRKGCIIFTVLLVLIIAGAGFAGYRYLRNSLDISPDLKFYSNKDSVLGKIRNHAPAPGRNEHLTRQQVTLFIGALDSAASGWRDLRAAIDSLHIRSGKDSSGMNIWASPKLVREIILAPLVTRRAIVGYLNRNNLSWEEYIWIKERTVAAADINEGDLDSAETAVMRSHFRLYGNGADVKRKLSHSDDFFRNVAQIRNGSLINDHDRELAAPYREVLLSRGLPALMGTETNLTDKNGGLTLGPVGED